jgi:chemotaxis protein MotA
VDITTIVGLLLGLSAIVISFIWEGGHLGSILAGPAMFIVIGGTIGASMITTSLDTILRIPRYMKIAFFASKHDHRATIELIVTLAERARRDGILGLEENLKMIKDPFFANGVRLVIDGTEVTDLKNILNTEASYIAERHNRGINLFRTMGGFSPTMGIIGTVLGLIHTLANTDDPSRMASAIASAFIATLWGVALANLVWIPISEKLKFRHEEEMSSLELITEGVASIQSGDNPRIIRTKLTSFINPNLRKAA